MPCLRSVLNVVNTAIQYEKEREHEHGWNEKVHRALIELALATSPYAPTLAVKALNVFIYFCHELGKSIADIIIFRKSATIDPPTLAEVQLPK